MMCKNCGKEIPRLGNNQRYCSSCGLQIKRARAREKYVHVYFPKTIKCKFCGKEIILKNRAFSRTKFCHICRTTNKRQYQSDYNKLYRETDAGKKAYQKLNRKRRAKLNNVKEEFTMEEWYKKVDATKGICPGYGHEPHFVGKDKLTLDHNPPLSKVQNGHIYTIEHVSPLCNSCNSRKNNKIYILGEVNFL